MSTLRKSVRVSAVKSSARKNGCPAWVTALASSARASVQFCPSRRFGEYLPG